jgi:hypothetical protein
MAREQGKQGNSARLLLVMVNAASANAVFVAGDR